MALIVGARKNTLAGRTKEYRFHASCSGTVDVDELVDVMARANAGLGREEIEAGFELLAKTVAELAADGNYVKTPLGAFFISAVGVADSDSSPFTPGDESSGHGFRLRFRPDRSFEARVIERVSVSRDDTSWQQFPKPSSMVPEGGRRDHALVPGASAGLTGECLSFDAEDEAQGVFFVRGIADAGVRVERYGAVRPKRVLFGVPEELEPGDYTIVVRSSTKAGTMRTGYLDGKVTVKPR